MEQFDYEIQHCSGSRMRHVDALSRYPVMMLVDETLTARVKQAQDTDETIKVLKASLEDHPEDCTDYVLKQDILFKYKDGYELLVIPECMQNEIIRRLHEKGHFSSMKTFDVLKKEVFMPNMQDKINKVVSCCVPCILINRKEGKKGLLHPLPKGECPLLTYHIDHLGPLKSTNKNYNHILVIVDSVTKFIWLYPTKSTTTAEF